MEQTSSGPSEQNPRSFFTINSPRSSTISPGSIVPLETDYSSTSSSSRVTASQQYHSHLVQSIPTTRRMVPRNELEISRPILARAEKDSDDPTASGNRRRTQGQGQSSTPSTISRLFGSQGSPPASRMPSFVRPASGVSRRESGSDIDPLPTHLYMRGLLDGRYSDIKVTVLGKDYALHRLVLDQAPFFASALSEPWLESTAKEVTLHPEEMDSNITSTSFELALRRLYGYPDNIQEARVALSVFATGCWLEMQDLVDASIEALLHNMRPKVLPAIINMVTENYYGKSGTRILEACKSLLSRDGLHMLMKYWDDIASEVIRDVVSGDSFFVYDEWERFIFAKRLVNRKLARKARQTGMTVAGKRSMAPAETRGELQRQNAHNDFVASHDVGQDHLTAWEALYRHPEMSPLFELIDHGINYIHLDFEQLQCVRAARDIFGVFAVPEKITNDALWAGLELRQKIVNANEHDEDLGLGHMAEINSSTDISVNHESYPLQPNKSKFDQGEAIHAEQNSSIPSSEKESARGNREFDVQENLRWKRKHSQKRFRIPNVDRNIVTGGTEPIITLSNRVSDSSAWPSKTRQGRIHGESQPGSYTCYPPYRFAAEFPNPRVFKDDKRTYSKTIFYAGSLWNLYIQRKRTASRNSQVGVYLHRAKERTPKNDSHSGSVDERIFALERDMLFRSNPYPRYYTGVHGFPDDYGTSDDVNLTFPSHLPGPSNSSPTYLGTRLENQFSESVLDSQMDDSSSDRAFDEPNNVINDNTSEKDSTSQSYEHSTLQYRKSALPPYYDNRPTIKAYFKIFSPSRGGRLLSIYESAPDCFDFSQSWGWKINNVMLEDECYANDIEIGSGVIPEEETCEQHDDSEDGVSKCAPKKSGSGKDMLRFMVVLGVV